jgi:signal transduction histidine kinase
MPSEAWAVLLVATVFAAAERWRSARRRTALNRALHEVRRPLQALSLLATGPMVPDRPRGMAAPFGLARDPVSDPVRQAISAVSDLDRELNGGPRHPVAPQRETLACRLLADSCVRRWQSRAALSGATLALEWTGPDVLVRGDGTALAAALENIIVNAIEHGGPGITVSGSNLGRRVRIEVTDNGRAARSEQHRDPPAQILARLRGRSAHGHGLAVASSTLADHGGWLEIDYGREGAPSRVCLVLPTVPAPGSSPSVKVNW